MADSDVTRKLHIYRALFRLNRSFAILSSNLDWLTVNRVLGQQIPNEMPQVWQSHLAEIQAEINRHITESLHNMEHGDVRRLGRIMEMSEKVRPVHLAKMRKGK